MKNRVLLTAIEEINKFTDIAVALNETKKSDSVNSKVTELNFIVTNKEVFKKTEKQINEDSFKNNSFLIGLSTIILIVFTLILIWYLITSVESYAK